MTNEQKEEMVKRIVALGPQVLNITDTWDLFKIKGFECDDLQATLAEADWSLMQAKIELNKKVK